MRTGVWVLALLAIGAVSQNDVETTLEDGKSHRGYIDSPNGGEHRYIFTAPSNLTSDEDLSLTLTTFSDASHPNLYLSHGQHPTPSVHDWSSEGWGSGSIILSSTDIVPGGIYYALVHCDTQCHFSLTLSHLFETVLEEGVPMYGFLRKARSQVYELNTTSWPGEELVITVTPQTTNARYELQVSDGTHSLPVSDSWHTGKTCLIHPVFSNFTYRITVTAISASLNYTVIAASSNGTQELQASVPTPGEVRDGQTVTYKVRVGSPDETVIVQLTTYVGYVDMYIRAAQPPTVTDWDFNSMMFGNETIAIAKHQRAELGHPTGDYYISLVAYGHTVFTITASEDRNSFVPLFAGIPQVGYADHKEVDLYYMDVPEMQQLNITVRVTAIYGNPDLFSKLCNDANQTACLFTSEMLKNPGDFNISYSKHKTGDESLFIRHSASQCPTSRCRYVIAVSGKSQDRTRFTISADYDDSTEYRLMEGAPIKMTQKSANYTYFKYTVFNETVMNLTIQLTPILGDPDLFVTRLQEKPTNEVFEKSSTKSLALTDSVSYVRGADGPSLVSTYHIAVFTYEQSTFSLVVMEHVPGKNTTIWIYSGQSQHDMLYNYTDSDYRLYSFNIHYTEETKQPIRVSLTPISGSFMLYVTNKPENLDWTKEIFYYDWASNDTSSHLQSVAITIEPTDPFYLMQSTYLVLVEATNFTGDHTASYVITYTSGDGITSLQEGVPFPDEVTEKVYRHYAFPIHYDHEDITITVSALNGDPDVYISLQPNNTRPSKEHFDKKSTSYGGEVIALVWEEGLAELCPGLPEEYNFGDPLNCMLYIAVYGYRAAVYTITVTARKDIPTLLRIEDPAIGQLTKAGYRFYYIQLHNSLPLTATLQSMSGDSDLFLNLFDYAQGGSEVNNWQRPTHDHSDFQSQSSALIDRIDIAAKFLTNTCPSGTCIALAGVYCFSSNPCGYSLFVSQEEVELLTEGQPRGGNVVVAQYAYYLFYNAKDSTSLLITLTAIAGDPDLYVSKGRDTRPTSDKSDWVSRGWRGENLLISSNDTHFNATSTMRGYYMIGVKGVTNSSYTIAVTTDPEPVLTIISGVPTRGSVPAHKSVFYEYYHYNDSSLEIKLTPYEGWATLKVTTAEASGVESVPSTSDFVWSSEGSGVRNGIFVTTSDPHFCSNCTYLIGVFAMDANCTYILTVSNGNDTITLVNGVPLQGSVLAGQWKYFTFYNPSDSDLDFSLTNYAGDADLYVSTTDIVDENHFNWTHATSRHVEHIHIPKDVQDPTQRLYLIGVKGAKNTSYSITAHSRDSAISLVDGWPHTYSIMLRTQDHLIFDYPLKMKEFTVVQCMVRPLSVNFWPSVAVLFTNRKDDIPSFANKNWDYSALDYDLMYGTLRFTLPKQTTIGFYRIGVFGAPIEGVSRDELGSFEISCSGQSSESVLRSGMVASGTLPLSPDHQRYNIYVPEVSTIEAILIPCHGRVSLGVSSNYTVAEENGPDIAFSHPTDGRITATIANAQGQYFVTVTPISPEAQGSDFELTVFVVPRGERLPQKPVAGNDGLLTWGIHDRQHITLSWLPAEYENGPQILENVDYFIFATTFLDHKMNTICSIRYSQKRNETWIAMTVLGNETLSTVVVEMPTGHPVLINVVGRIQSEINALLTTVVYDPTEIILRVRNSNRRFSLLLTGVVTVALVFALVALFFLYRKYKRVQRRLENEMMDIGKVASISSEQLDPDSLWDDAQRRGMAYIPFQVSK